MSVFILKKRLLVVQTHMYFDPEPSDEAAERLMYIQAVYDVVSSRYPCNEEDCKTLAGLQLQFELGTKRLPDLEVTAAGCFGYMHGCLTMLFLCGSQTKLKRFLPAKMCTDERKSELGAEIQKRHKTHSGKSSSEIQRAYLRHVKAWKVRVSYLGGSIAHCVVALRLLCWAVQRADLRLTVLPCGATNVSRFA